MKRKMFDLGLYKEGIRRSRTIGIICAIICGLVSLGYPVFCILMKFVLLSDSGYAQKTVIGFKDVFGAQSFLYTVIVPLMVLILFNFLNKRRSSDFFHSVPQTRTCLYISLMAAVMTWIFSIAIIITALNTVIYLIFSPFFILNIVEIILGLLGLIACCFLVMSSVVFAMSVTGTLFNNIVVSLLVLYVPRIMMLIFTQFLMMHIPFIDELFSGTIMNTGYNIVADTFVAQLYSTIPLMSISVDITLKSVIYTTIIGVMYFVLGMLCFKKRKSEMAGNAAPNRLVQSVYRIAIVLPLTLFATCFCLFSSVKILINTFKDPYVTESDTSDAIATLILMLIVVAVICFFAVLLYFLYELIATRKWKNVLKAFPGLLVVLGINILVFGGMYGMFYIENLTVPKANDIKYVTISEYEESTSFGFSFYGVLGIENEKPYYSHKSSEVKIDDAQIKNIVARLLKEEAENSMNSKNIDVDLGGMDDFLFGTEEKEYGSGVFEVSVKSGIFVRKYKLHFSGTDYTTLMNIMSHSRAYKAVYDKLPSTSRYGTSVYVSNGVLSEKAAERIYMSAIDDISTLSFEDKYAVLNGNYIPHGAEYDKSYDLGFSYYNEYLDVLVIEKGEVYGFKIPIVPELKNTYATYWSEMNKATQKDKQAITGFIQNDFYPYNSSKIGMISIDVYENDTSIYECFYDNTYDDDYITNNTKRLNVMRDFYNMLLDYKAIPVDGTGVYCKITVYEIDNFLFETETSHTAYYEIPDEYVYSEEFKNMCDKLDEIDMSFYGEYYNLDDEDVLIANDGIYTDKKEKVFSLGSGKRNEY